MKNFDEPTNAQAKRDAGHATKAKQGAYVGTRKAIEDALRVVGEATQAELVTLTGKPASAVKSSLNAMAGHVGGIVSYGPVGGRHKDVRRYALIDSPEGRRAQGKDEKIDVRIATPRSYEFKPLWRDPLAHMHLAMSTRRV